MFDCSDITTYLDDEFRDPRINREFFRCLSETDQLGSVLLVGVVHDHPASIFRVTHLLETVVPDVLAVELPPLAVPLFRMYGRDRYTPPRLGGEMSAAIQTASDAPIVGIDAPNPVYFKLLANALLAERRPDVLKTVLRDFTSSLAHAVACRLGALVGSVTPLRPRLYSHIEYECSLLDPPAAQADHERTYLAQRQTFLRAIKTPPPIEYIDTAREGGMVVRLHELRAAGDIVAVVGMEHLDSVYTQLLERAQQPQL